jgi:putative glutamine amidotransferase
MSVRPLFGVTCCTRQLGPEPAQSVMNRYLEPTVRHAEADAVLIPALPGPSDMRGLLARLDGLLLTGSPSNIEPVRYGADGGDGPFDPARDATSLALVRAALVAGKPVFGICRGMQELNVALGGSLRRDLGAAHHAPDDADFADMFGYRHQVALAPDGVLSAVIGRTEMQVNSVHYQGVGQLGAGLRTEARSADGLVEAISADAAGALVLAVQWHPEWDADSNAESRAFFQLFGRVLRGDVPDGFQR